MSGDIETVTRIPHEPPTRLSEEVRTRCVKAFLDLIVMSILMVEPTHGYDIMAKIHRHLFVFLSAGQVYPLFSRLERDGLIEARLSEDGRRKIFTMTNRGMIKYKDMLHETKQIYHILAYFALLNEDQRAGSDDERRLLEIPRKIIVHQQTEK